MLGVQQVSSPGLSTVEDLWTALCEPIAITSRGLDGLVRVSLLSNIPIIVSWRQSYESTCNWADWTARWLLKVGISLYLCRSQLIYARSGSIMCLRGDSLKTQALAEDIP